MRSFVLVLCTCLAGCASPTPAGLDFARRIENAHGARAWAAQDAVACDITVNYGGAVMLDGSMLYEPSGGRVRIETADALLVFDGERAWVSPASAEVRGARFQLLTWPYFLAVPFKLRDPGTYLAPHGRRPLDNVIHVTALLTFESGVGDSPDDWYVVYRQPATNRLAAVAYIVTYGRPVDAAEEEPHALVYDEYETVDGVTLSTRWVMYDWTLADGPVGQPLGDVTLANLRFVEAGDADFARPEDAREDPRP
jgi:hypothetical protein